MTATFVMFKGWGRGNCLERGATPHPDLAKPYLSSYEEPHPGLVSFLPWKPSGLSSTSGFWTQLPRCQVIPPNPSLPPPQPQSSLGSGVCKRSLILWGLLALPSAFPASL